MKKLTPEQIKMALKYRKARAKLKDIPTQAELAAQWGVSQKAVSKALAVLEKRSKP